MNLFEKQAQLNQLFTQSNVSAAYLAGSLAGRATFGHLTDVDIAILLMEQIGSDQFLDYQLYLFSELTKRLESDTIDVVILNQASLLLKLQVIKYGQILYCRDEKKRVAFETRAVMDYLDFKRLDEIQHDALARRLHTTRPPVDRESLRAPTQRLHGALERLRGLRDMEQEAFVSDFKVYGLAERYLLLAVEACLQACNVLVASLGLRRPEGYHDLLSIVAAQNLIQRPLAYRLEPLTDLREPLLSEPDTLDHTLLYDHLRQHLSALEEFAEAMDKLCNESA
ncbi:MAG TPA: HepT-like ribonuclease domain-containing protein [Ktedonobacterales bacterium]|nr:HepT-like ribonuclease domain-containing protein [Ktedonobacterales bacterium]